MYAQCPYVDRRAINIDRTFHHNSELVFLHIWILQNSMIFLEKIRYQSDIVFKKKKTMLNKHILTVFLETCKIVVKAHYKDYIEDGVHAVSTSIWVLYLQYASWKDIKLLQL